MLLQGKGAERKINDIIGYLSRGVVTQIGILRTCLMKNMQVQ